jgi:hypothetical protein
VPAGRDRSGADCRSLSAPPVAGEGDPTTTERTRWIATMQARADERVRAAGWLIGSEVGEDADRDRLAILAASSGDPLVVAYALRACRSGAAQSSACLALPPESWATLEPDNTAAWLALAADPRVGSAQQLDALQRAAQAPRLDSYGPTLHALAEAAQPAGLDAAEGLAMARDIATARGDWMPTEALRLHCNARDLADTHRAATCAALAEALADRAQSLPDLVQAREIGQRLGWPADRLDALRDDIGALVAGERQIVEGDDASDCDTLQRSRAFYADVARLGEVGALRAALRDAPAR